MRPNAIAVVLAANLVLAVGMVLLWSDEKRTHWTEPAPLPPLLGETFVVQPAPPVELSQYRETVERPLFALNRRRAPASTGAAEGQPVSDPLKDVRLLGTYGTGERGGIVVVSGGKVQRIAVGASIGEWKVVGEEGRGAALVHPNGERRRLELALNTSAPTSPGKDGGDGAKGAAGAAEAKANGGSPPVAPPQAATQPSGPVAGDARDQLRRQRLDRINARRAQRGLPPVSE